jgi:Fe-S cluster biogenesis protein NfuA
MSVDPGRLARRVKAINVLIGSHAGEVEVVRVSPQGAVSIRYTGMCTGCEYRPVTTAGTVEPALLDVPGVSEVIVVGARVSEEALARIGATLDQGDAASRAVRVVRRLEAEGDENVEGERP